MKNIKGSTLVNLRKALQTEIIRTRILDKPTVKISTSLNTSINLDGLDEEEKKQKIDENCEWVIETTDIKREEISPNPKKYKGKSINSLLNRINTIYQEEIQEIVPCVACLIEIDDCDKEEKFIRNTGIATYLIIESVDAKSLRNKSFWREYTVAYNSRYERDCLLETKLALFDDEYIYPITNLAKGHVGKLLDAIASFKDIDDLPIGGALLLNSKLEKRTSLDILYEDNGTKIRPLVSVCSKTYGGYSPKEFFNKMFTLMNKNFFFYNERDVKWKIEDGVISIEIPLQGFSLVGLCYQPILKLTTSIMPGISNRVEILAKIGKGYVSIKENTKYHNREDVDDMMDGFTEELQAFNEIASKVVNVFEQDCKNLKLIIGKKRYDNLRTISNNKTIKDITLEDFIEDTWEELPPKQMHQLMEEYKVIFQNKKVRNVAS